MSQFIIIYSELNSSWKAVKPEVYHGYVESETGRTLFRIWAKHFVTESAAYEAIDTLTDNTFWHNCTFEVEQLD